jgi:hypothetical protein
MIITKTLTPALKAQIKELKSYKAPEEVVNSVKSYGITRMAGDLKVTRNYINRIIAEASTISERKYKQLLKLLGQD